LNNGAVFERALLRRLLKCLTRRSCCSPGASLLNWEHGGGFYGVLGSTGVSTAETVFASPEQTSAAGNQRV
jgi:hypothetical protein